MANQVIVATQDTWLDGASTGNDRSGSTIVRAWASAAGDSHGAWEFDVSSIATSNWTVVRLHLTYQDDAANNPATTWFFVRSRRAWVMGELTWDDASASEAWASGGARNNSSDHNHGQEIVFPWPTAPHAIGDVIMSPDLTDLVESANNEDGGVLRLLLMRHSAAQSGGGIQDWHSIEGGTGDEKPRLIFSDFNVPVDLSPAPPSVVQVGSPVTLTSDRPPLQEPDRQVTVAIRSDGPEPMTILSIIQKLNFGTDA